MVGRPREFDETEALDAAVQAFWDHGFKATSLADLTRRMGIERPSLYGAFGDKHQLFLAALERYQAIKLAALRGALVDQHSPKAAIESVLTDSVDRIRTERSARGCLAVNSMIELAPHDPEVTIRLQAYRDAVEQLFFEALERAKDVGELSSGKDSRALAHFLIVTLNGLEVLAKTRPAPAFAEDALRVALAALGV